MVNLPRNATQHLQSLFAAFPVVVVTGARQVGKTTLQQQVFPDLDYVVFDASLDLEQARSEPDLFLRNHPAPLILDEIQYAPELVASIKRVVDARHAKPGQFLLTGSQQWQVMQALAESLAGRVAFVELSGLSLGELTHTQPQTASSLWLHRWMQAQEQGAQQAFADQARASPCYPGHLQEWLWRGFMPKAQTLDLALVPDFWQGYHRTCVERDARLAGEVGDWHDFGRFVRLIIERDGWLHPIEIKLTAQPTRKQTLGLQGFRKAHPDQRIGHGLMLCAVEQPRWISEDVLALPWNLL
jgi:predicted AAA+ superfamily ATPase